MILYKQINKAATSTLVLLIQVDSGDGNGAPRRESGAPYRTETRPGLGTVNKRHDIMKRQMKEISRGWHDLPGNIVEKHALMKRQMKEDCKFVKARPTQCY